MLNFAINLTTTKLNNMKKKILEALETKFSGVNAQILDRIATKLAKTVQSDDDVEKALEEVSFQSIIDSEGDRRATDASKSAVANYEKRFGLKDGEKVGADNGKNEESEKEPDNEMPAWAKAIVEQNKELTAKLHAMEGEKLISSRKNEIANLIKDLPQSLQKVYNRMDLQSLDDKAFTSLQTEIKAEVEALQKDISGKRSVFTPPISPNASNSSQASKEEVEAVLKGL